MDAPPRSDDTREPLAETRSLGSQLETMRRRHRADRLELVLQALHDRCLTHGDAGMEPPALRAAIENFRTELMNLAADQDRR